jgi:hypothetical protein
MVPYLSNCYLTISDASSERFLLTNKWCQVYTIVNYL